MTCDPFPSIKLSQWPERDRALWKTAQKQAVLFDAGIAASWSPSTIRNCEQSYGRWLGWLPATGGFDANLHPADRVTRQRIAAFYDAYSIGRAELTVAGTLRDIAYVLRGCAPPDGVEWLTKLAHRLVNSAKPSRPKLPRMAPVAEVIAASERIMAEGLAMVGRGKRMGLSRYRDGLMIGLLIRRPLRRRNLAGLRLGRNFFRETVGMRINIPACETKKGIAITASLPADLHCALGVYFEEVRPALLEIQSEPDEGWLWISQRGGRLNEQDISVRITRLTRKYLGVDMSPHLFRDSAATEIALRDPVHVGIAKDVLQHAMLASSQTTYNQATSFTAVARHADVIKNLRGDG